jgi:hypothetical protein
MKKLIVTIVILSIIFVGMIVYKNILIKTNNISIQEIEKIEDYINQIYMWKEVTEEALPYFENINEANEKWIWEVVKKNMEDDEASYEEIQEKAQEIFGQAFSQEFPKEENKYFTYNEQTNKYKAIEVELDQEGDLFLLNKIEKTKDGYEVEIVEYLEDYSPMLKEDAEDFIIIKNLEEEEIGPISGSTKEEETELVKRNIDKFSKKKIILKEENQKLYIERVYK